MSSQTAPTFQIPLQKITHAKQIKNLSKYMGGDGINTRNVVRAVQLSLRSYLKVPELSETLSSLEGDVTLLRSDFSEIMNTAINAIVCEDDPAALAFIDWQWSQRQLTTLCARTWSRRYHWLAPADIPPNADTATREFLRYRNMMLQSRNLEMTQPVDERPFTFPPTFHLPVVPHQIRHYVGIEYCTALKNRACTHFKQIFQREMFWRMRRHFGQNLDRAERRTLLQFVVESLAFDGLPPPIGDHLPQQQLDFATNVALPFLRPMVERFGVHNALQRSAKDRIRHWWHYLFFLGKLQKDRVNWVTAQQAAGLATFDPPPSFNLGPIFRRSPSHYRIDKNGLKQIYSLHRAITTQNVAQFPTRNMSRTFDVRRFNNKTLTRRWGSSLTTDGTTVSQAIVRQDRPEVTHSSTRWRGHTEVPADAIVLGLDPNKPELTGVGFRTVGEDNHLPANDNLLARFTAFTVDYFTETGVFRHRESLNRYTREQGIDKLNNTIGNAATSDMTQVHARVRGVGRFGAQIQHLYHLGPSKEYRLEHLFLRDKFLHFWARCYRYIGLSIQNGERNPDFILQDVVRYSRKEYRRLRRQDPPPPPAPVVLAPGQIKSVYVQGLRGNTSPLQRLLSIIHNYDYAHSIVPTNEYLTSQVCNRCQRAGRLANNHAAARLTTVRVGRNRRQLWRIKRCNICKMDVNRDRNAAANILTVFLHQNEHDGQRPLQYRR